MPGNYTYTKQFKMRKIISRAALFLTIITSCNKPIETNLTHGLKAGKDLLSIKISSSIHPQARKIQSFINNDESILAYGSGNQIYFFSLDQLALIKSTNYEEYGPNGISVYKGFYVINMDSIVLTSQTSIILADSENKIHKKLDQLEWNTNASQPHIIFPPAVGSDNYPIRINDKLYFTTFQFDLESIDFTKTPIGLVYDLNNNIMKEMDFNYPRFPSNYTTAHHGVSRVYSEGKWIHSFDRLDNLFVFDAKGEYAEYPVTSVKHMKKVKIINRNIFSSENLISQPYYMSLKYDPWRKVYYRIYYQGFDAENKKEQAYYDSLIETRPVFTIIITDCDFKVIGETTMPFQKYDPLTNFITKDGLFFGLHVNHPDFNPNYLQFVRLSLEALNP